jgi:hypothetical protein
MPVRASRVEQKIRTTPRVWGKVSDSIEMRLEDELTLVKDIEAGGTEDGTPVSSSRSYGPFEAKLSTPEGAENWEGDRFHQETTHTAVVRIGEILEPHVRDRAVVKRKGKKGPEYFRIIDRVKDRTPAWDGVFLWHLQLAKTEEF